MQAQALATTIQERKIEIAKLLYRSSERGPSKERAQSLAPPG
jgi:hypothetical protein